MIKKGTIALLTLLILGFIYRYFLASVSEHNLYWDMGEYSSMAKQILSTGFTANCCTHGAGYPLFLAGVYKLFGVENIFFVRIAQIILDIAVAFLIYRIAEILFGKKIAWFSFIIYIFNPFTAAYTGMVLSESLTIFIVTLILFLLVQPKFYESFFYAFFTGVFLGVLSYIKISFYFVTIILAVLIPIVAKITFKRKVQFGLVIIFSFFLAIVYPLLANYKKYKVLSVMPPYRSVGILLYGNYYIGYYPELTSEFGKMNPTYARLTEEYYSTYVANPAKYKDYDQKYMRLFWEKTEKEWPIFIKNTFVDMFLIWDKRYLYTYTDPFYPVDLWILRITNLVLIGLFLVGFYAFLKKSVRNKRELPVIIFISLLGLYISFALGIVSSESRLSLPFYPILILFAGYGFYTLFKKAEYCFNSA